MKIGFQFEMDTNSGRDRRILRNYLDNLARGLPMIMQMVNSVGSGRAHEATFGQGEPVGAVASEAEVRGRDALRELVAAYRVAKPTDGVTDMADFKDVLTDALGYAAADLIAYVESVGDLATAIASVWSPQGVAMTPDLFHEEIVGAAEAAANFVSIGSALGFTIPPNWYSKGGVK